MHSLDIVTDMFVLIEKLHDVVAENNFLHVCSRLLKPFLEETRTNLSSGLVEQAIQTASLARDA